ncbi:MAG: hypothetical protein AAGH88_06500 [Planctomycetota bacterium]
MHHTPLLAALLGLVALLLPQAANAQDDHPLLGVWYMQAGNGEATPEGVSMAIEFRGNGELRVSTIFGPGQGDEPEISEYQHNPERQTLTFRDAGQQIEFTYSFADETLTLRGSDGEETMVIELTRDPDGTARHQEMRKAQGQAHPVDNHPARAAYRMQSATQLRGIHQGLVVYSNSNREMYPQHLGALLQGEFVTADYLLAPWAEVEVPEDIDDWDDERKAQWVAANTSYAFVAGGDKFEVDFKKVVLFELPLYSDTETIAVCFDDNRVERMDYDEADAVITEQTGKTIMQWMEAMGREQIDWEPGDEDAAEDPGAAEAEDAEDVGKAGPTGTWYVQKMDGAWLPAQDVFRLEFRDDGTCHIFENGELEEGPMRYVVVPDRRVIQILNDIDDPEVDIELRYALYDDVMIITFEEGGREDQIIFCRRPEGTADHQRARSAVPARDRGDGAAEIEGVDRAEDAGDAVGEELEEAGDAVRDLAE